MHAHTISRNARTVSRNVHAHASMFICVQALVIILVRTYVCPFVCACSSASIHAPASMGIYARGDCYAYLSVVLSNTLVLGELDHISRTSHDYIQAPLWDSLYNNL